MSSLSARSHIQNFTADSVTVPHWGYADRVVPCTNDAGSCAYLDVVYHSHDLGMVYTGIFWATICGILFVWTVGRRVFMTEPDGRADLKLEGDGQVVAKPSTVTRLGRSIAAGTRAYLLPNSLRPLFGRTTRLQVLILAILVGYLTIWSFAGIVYATWITPIKSSPNLHNTRTSLGPWADRVGVLAYALTPLSVLLASRESILSVLTGVPYTSFIFLHRWTGYIIVMQSVLHTIGWIIIEARLYQPQPATWLSVVRETYVIWGFVALSLLLLLWLLTLQVTIRHLTGYEFFRKAHYVLAVVYMGALVGHWEKLQCFLVPGLALWFFDRAARVFRTGMLHHRGNWGFAPVQATARLWKDDSFGHLLRLDFEHHQLPWKIGQHFFLCFTEGSIWQSHPFTPLSLPVATKDGKVRHSYIVRAKKGETKKLADVISRKMQTAAEGALQTTNVILQGPYGEDITEGLTRDFNVLCVAGGTGLTYVLPVLLKLVRASPSPARRLELVWAVKRKRDVDLVRPELTELQSLGQAHGLFMRIFITHDSARLSSLDEGVLPSANRENGQVEVNSREDSSGHTPVDDGSKLIRYGLTESLKRPDLGSVMRSFIEGVGHGATRVFGSGPPGMIGDLRSAVAVCNSGVRVWKGEDRFDVDLVCDDRLEW